MTWDALDAGKYRGNVYVNRSIIGAAVGVQPFGGEGLSGTGSKAGGPHALSRCAVERALSVNIALFDDAPVRVRAIDENLDGDWFWDLADVYKMGRPPS